MWKSSIVFALLIFSLSVDAYSAETGSRASKAPGATNLPPGTLELIRAQALKAKELALERGATEAQDELRKAENQIKAEQDKITRLEMAAGGRGDQPAVSPQELQEMRNRAAENMERLRQIGAAKAANKEQESQMKAEDLQRQADALEKQILRSRNQQDGELKLNPVGTNLYVRNYVDVRPPAKPLRAIQQTLPVTGVGTQTAAAIRAQSLKNSAQMRKTGLNGTSTHTDVRGILIKP